MEMSRLESKPIKSFQIRVKYVKSPINGFRKTDKHTCRVTFLIQVIYQLSHLKVEIKTRGHEIFCVDLEFHKMFLSI